MAHCLPEWTNNSEKVLKSGIRARQGMPADHSPQTAPQFRIGSRSLVRARSLRSKSLCCFVRESEQTQTEVDS